MFQVDFERELKSKMFYALWDMKDAVWKPASRGEMIEKYQESFQEYVSSRKRLLVCFNNFFHEKFYEKSESLFVEFSKLFTESINAGSNKLPC